MQLEALEQRQLLAIDLDLVAGSAMAAGTNIDVSNSARQQSEMQIAVNPSNPLELAGVATSFITGTEYDEIDVYLSQDGGATWTKKTIGGGGSNLDDGRDATAKRFDPTIGFDATGRLYVGYGVQLATTRELVVATSTDGGTTFSYAAAVTDPTLDKFLLAAGRDPSNAAQQNLYLTYTIDAGGGMVSNKVAISTDGGATFTQSPFITDQATDNASFAMPVVGPNGELFVIWDDFDDAPGQSTIKFDVSTDAGSTFGTDVIIGVTDVTYGKPNGFSPAGTTRYHITPQPDRGILAVPSMAVDPASGDLYAVYTVANGASTDDTDIVLQKSTDNGATWSTPTVVHSASTASQFLPWVTVDPETSTVYVAWLDGRNNSNEGVELFVARSTDGGSTFTELLVASNPSNQSQSNPSRVPENFLEYFGLTASSGIVYTLWPDNSAAPSNLSAMFARSVGGDVQVTITGDATGDDTLTIRESSTNPDFLEFILTNGSGTETKRVLKSAIAGVTANLGSGTGDRVVIEAGAGLSLGSGLQVNKTGGREGTLEISGSGATSASLSLGAASSTLNYGSLQVTFNTLGSVVLNATGLSDINITDNDGAATDWIVRDDAGNSGRSEVVTSSPTLQRFRFANPSANIFLTGDNEPDSVRLEALDSAATAQVTLALQGGNDTVEVIGASTTTAIDGGDGADRMFLGVAAGQEGTGVGDLSGITDLVVAAQVEHVTADSGSVNSGSVLWRLQADGVASDLRATTMPSRVLMRTADLQTLRLEGSAADDVLAVDFSAGNPLPPSTTFNGAGQTAADGMILSGGSFTSITHTFTNANDGTVQFNGSQTITYTGLEPILDNNDAADRVFTFTQPASDARLEKSGTQTRIASSVNESVTFTTPSNSLTVNLAGGAGDSNQFTIAGLADGYNTPTNIIQGTDGSESFIVEALAGGGLFRMVGGLGDDSLSITPTSGTPSALNGSLDFVADGGNDTVTVNGASETTGRSIAWNDNKTTGLLAGSLDFDYQGIETYSLTTGSGDDQVTVTPTAFVDLDIDFNTPPSPNPPGDRLVVDLNGTSGGTALLSQTPGNGTVLFDPPHRAIDFVSAEQIDSLNGNLNFGVAGTNGDDTFLLQKDSSGTNIQLSLNGTNIIDKPASEIERLYLAGLDGNDQLVVDGTNGLAVPAGTLNGIDNPNVPGLPQILYDGGAGNDSMLYQDLPAGYDVTYGVGDGGAGNFDEGEVSTRVGGEDQRIYFRGLEPIYYTTPGGGSLDVYGTSAANTIDIEAATPIPGLNATGITIDSYEPIYFGPGAFASLGVYGMDGADTITMKGFGIDEDTITGLTLSALQPGGTDDSSNETVNLWSNMRPKDAVGVNTSILTGGGDDVITIADASNTVSNVLGEVTVDAGGTGTDNDVLVVDDSGSTGPSETVVLTSSTIDGITGTGGAGQTINYTNVDGGRLILRSNGAGHTYRVRSTASGLTATELWTGGGNDTIEITDAGSANGVVSPIELYSGGGNDSLTIDDTADGADNVIHMDDTQIGGGAFNTPVATGGIFGTGGILTYNSDLEAIQISAGNGANTINVDATGVGGTAPTSKVTIDDGSGNSSFFIQANRMAAGADHTFRGNDGNDVLHVFVAAGTDVAGNTFRLDGGNPADDSSNRDAVLIHDAGGARNVEFDYQSDTSGDVDVRIDSGTPIDANTVETLRYFGDAANDDTMRVIGTPADDDLTVAPLSANSFLAFLNGNPWDGPSDSAGFSTAFPGLAGGGSGPDMQVTGVRQDGLTVTGGGAGTSGDQLYVYGRSESDLVDAATSADPFGFGTGVLIPGAGTGNAYDRTEVTDARVRMVNNASGALVDVNIDTTSFAQTDARSKGLFVNTGLEAAPPANGIADDITAFLSFGGFAMQINGGDPTASFAPQGDRLNVITPGEINIFSDKSTPPEVTITSTHPVSKQTSFGLGFSSIENVTLTPGLTSQTVNIYGDNNLPSVDQPDNFVVRGADVDSTLTPLATLAGNPLYNPTNAPVHPDYEVDPDGDNEFFLEINGSSPIGFRNVTRLNVMGDDAAGTPSSGNDIDRLEVTPYADNVPTGWGIDVRFDEGNPGADATATPDLLVVNGVSGVAERTTVTPSAPGAGQVSVQNAATGTPIVVIDYTTNTGLEINGNDGSAGDTDRLVLLGSDGTTTNGTSGRDRAEIDFTATGQPGAPVVRMLDTASNAVLYELFTISQSFTFETVTVDLLGGDDQASVETNTAVDVTVLGGGGNDALTGAGTNGVALDGGSGDDTLIGGDGADRLVGGAGADVLNGGRGDDKIYGGLDGDFVHWATGDGNDIVDGGAGGGDRLHLVGSSAADNWSLANSASGIVLTAGAESVQAAEMEVWNLLPGDGSDTVTVGTLSNGSLERVEVTLAGSSNLVKVNGTTGSDELEAGAAGTVVSVTGLPYAVSISGASTANSDQLELLGGDGDDRLSVTDDVANLMETILRGGAGDDALFGAAGTQTLDGGTGNDRLYASNGDDTAQGGAGTDQLIYLGTTAADTLSLTQTGTNLVATGLYAGTTSVASGDVEQILIATDAGDDSVTLSGLAIPTTVEAGSGNDTVDGSAVSAASLTLLGEDGADTLTGGDAADLLDGGAGDDRLTGGNGDDVLLGGAGSDTLTGGAGADQIRGGADSDTIVWAAGDGSDVVDAGSGVDILSYSGSAGSDSIALAASGTSVSVTLGAETVSLADTEQLDIDPAGGDDSVVIGDLSKTPVERVSVDLANGNDSVTMDGRVSDDTLQAGMVGQAITIAGMPYDVVLSSPDTDDAMTIRGNDGDDTIKVTPGVENTIAVTLEGGAGDDYLSADATLRGGDGNDWLVGGAGDDTMEGGAGDDTFVGNGGTDRIDGGTGSDRIYVAGTAASDNIVAQRTAAGELEVSVNGTITRYTDSTSTDINNASIEGLDVDGDAGNDLLTVRNDAGLISFIEGILYRGGTGLDWLETAGSLPLDAAIYSVGPTVGSGRLVHIAAGGQPSQFIEFSGLEPVDDSTTAAIATVVATNASNAIGLVPTGSKGTVSVDGQEVYVFTNKTQVTLSGDGGDDNFDITLPDANGTPITGLTTIVTQGAGGSDSVTLRDETSSATTYDVAPTGAGATTVTAGGLTVRTDTIDQLAIEGDLAQGDQLTLTGTGATDTFTLESVDTRGSGRITMSSVSFDAVPLQFSGFSPTSPIRFDSGQGGIDTFVLRTSDQSDGVQVTAAGGNTFVTHQLITGAVNAAELVGFSAAALRTLGGPDFVRIVEPILPVLAEAGSASDGNVLTYVAGTGMTDVEFGPADEVVELTTASVPVVAIGIQTIQATVTQAPTIWGSSENERMTVTPADTGNGATVSVENHPTKVEIIGANTFNVDLSSGDDRLRVVGDSSGESIDVSDTSVATPKGTVNFTDTEALEVFGQEGSDTFNVTPGAIPMFVDGGDPIGVSPGGDRIVVTAVGPIGLYAGPENDEGSVVVGTSEPVSFDRIEDLDILGGPGAGPVTVFATNADDEITVIARDGSTRPGADGIEDFTISINDGVEVYFQDIAQLGIDGLAGDDDFTLRTPAPNGAVWNTDVTFVGGPGTDVLDLETPGEQLLSVNVTPTGPETGRIELPEISSNVVLSQDPLPQTTPPIIGGNGGFERINVDGETNGDRLTVFGGQGDDTIVHTPGSATDAGEVRVGTWLPVGYEDLGTTGTLTIDGATGNDTLSVLGTSGRDQVTVAPGSGAISVDNRQVIQTNAIETLSLETLSGDDVIDVASPSPYGNVVVEGGDPGTGSDVLRVRTTQQSVDAITWSPARNQPTDQTLAVSGGPTYAVSGIEEVELEADSDDTLDVLSGSGNDTITVDAGAFGQRLTVSGMPTLEYRGVNQLTVDGQAGSDSVQFLLADLTSSTAYRVRGSAQDTLTVVGNDARGDNLTLATATGGTFRITDGTTSASIESLDPALGRVVVEGQGGDDSLTVDVSGGLIGSMVTFLGGQDHDLLTMTANGGPTTQATYTPGPIEGSGRIVHEEGQTQMVVDFEGLEPVVDLIPGNLLVNGTNADNAINYSTNLGLGVVTIDGQESISFANKASLSIDGKAGDDVFNLNGTGAVPALIGISITGGDSTTGDRVIINGSANADTIGVGSLGTHGAVVTGAQYVLQVVVSSSENLTIVGGGGDDTLAIDAIGSDSITVTPGDTVDSGNVQVDSNIPIDFSELGSGGLLQLTGTQVSTQLRVMGTSGADTFFVNDTSPQIQLNSQVPIATTDIESYRFSGLGDTDTFYVEPIVETTMTVEGGDATDGDRLVVFRNTTGSDVVSLGFDDSVTMAPGRQIVWQQGMGRILHTGIEQLSLRANDADVVVSGTRFDDTLTVTPQSEDSAIIESDRVDTVYIVDGVPSNRTLTITGGGAGSGGSPNGGFADRVVYVGTSASELIRADSTDRTVELDLLGFGYPAPVVGSLRSIKLDDGTVGFGQAGNVEVLDIQSGSGSDTIHVVPGAPVGNGLYINVDGGEPQASDALVITDLDANNNPVPLGPNDFVVVGQSRNPDAGNVIVYQGGQRRPGISYRNVEIVSPNVSFTAGDPNLLFLGPDNYEANEYRQTAAYLGAGDSINASNLAIFPNAAEHPGVPADQDYFRVVAETTGVLDFQVYFRTFDPNLLPAGGQLNIAVLDADGTHIAGDSTIVPPGQPSFGTFDNTPDARIRIPAVAGQTYYLHVFGANGDVVNGYDITIDNYAPPVPYDIELDDIVVGDGGTPQNSDTGRSHFDNITRDNTPVIYFRLDDGIFLHDLPGNGTDDSPADEVIPIPFVGNQLEPGYRVAVFVEGDPRQNNTTPQAPVGYARQYIDGGSVVEGVYVFDFDTDTLDPNFELEDGSQFISARVEIVDPATPNHRTGFGDRSASLEIIVDTEKPPVSFGLPAAPEDGMAGSSDSGVVGNVATFTDRVTNVTTPTFYGYAEADAFVRLYADANNNGTLDAADVLLGQTTSQPYDGNNQFPNGQWEITSNVSLNDPEAFPTPLGHDGLRRMFVTAEDVAGNVSDPEELLVFIDTQGPQITRVYLTDAPSYDLFDPKPSTDGPTPLANRITIDVRDLPNRSNADPNFLYPALDETVAETLGNYSLVGDNVGIVPIKSVTFVSVPNPPVNGQPATGRLILEFEQPLPDDRYTLTVSDTLVDPAGNALDGESQTVEPHENPTFPTGDGQPGGDFKARFTIDSRPELGTWAAGSIWVDTNGNNRFDPDNFDFTNRDITYTMGYTSDDVFAGNFVESRGAIADGFDKLAAYGRVDGNWRWLIDTDNDGVPNIEQVDPLGINGIPVAGNFDGNAANGDEVAVFTGDTWYFDVNHDFLLDAASALPTTMKGLPIVGDFNGDGRDDLATWTDDWFQIDTNRDGTADHEFRFGFIGVREHPVAADFNQDGYDDLGLWVPDRSGVDPIETGEWYILVSGELDNTNNDVSAPGVVPPPAAGKLGPSIIQRIVMDPIRNEPVVNFQPVPFGNDIYVQYGDDFALPIVGNFDPPVTPGTGGENSNPHTNPRNPFDVNDDGVVSPLDALVLIQDMSNNGARELAGGNAGAPYLDVNADGLLSPLDVLSVVNALSGQASGEGEGDSTVMVYRVAEGEDTSRAAALESVDDVDWLRVEDTVDAFAADLAVGHDEEETWELFGDDLL